MIKFQKINDNGEKSLRIEVEMPAIFAGLILLLPIALIFILFAFDILDLMLTTLSCGFYIIVILYPLVKFLIRNMG